MHIEQEALSVRQVDLLSRVPLKDIAHGLDIPRRLLDEFAPKGRLLDLGAGTGIKGVSMRDRYTGIETNRAAVEAAEHMDSVAVFQGDVRFFWNTTLNLAMINYLEKVQGVICRGVFANMVTDSDIQNTILTADIALAPGGHTFFAETVLFDAMHFSTDIETTIIAGHTLMEWRKRWLRRYKLNAEAGLPYGVFAVACPNELQPWKKDVLDWPNSVEDVKRLMDSPDLERFARHIDPKVLDAVLQPLDYTKVYQEDTIVFSRLGEPLPARIRIDRKDYGLKERGERVYRYMQWGFKGSTIEEMQKGIRRTKSHGLLNDLRRNMPKSQQPPKKFTLG